MSRYVFGNDAESRLHAEQAAMASLRREFHIYGAVTIAAVAAAIWFLRK